MGNKISNSRLHPLFSDSYEWLCLRRFKHPPSSDVWDFRRNSNEIKEFVIEDFTKGSSKLSVQKKLTLSCGDTIAIWSSRDARVIKVLTAIIQETLKPVSVKPVTTTSIRHPQSPLPTPLQPPPVISTPFDYAQDRLREKSFFLF